VKMALLWLSLLLSLKLICCSRARVMLFYLFFLLNSVTASTERFRAWKKHRLFRR